jgi:hypothetical protein
MLLAAKSMKLAIGEYAIHISPLLSPSVLLLAGEGTITNNVL